MEQLLLAQQQLNNLKPKEIQTTISTDFLSKFTAIQYQEIIKFNNPVKGKSKSKRNEQFEVILNIINADRVTSGYKEVTAGRLAKLLKTANIIDLDVFIGSMKDAKNPAKFFWWKIKQI